MDGLRISVVICTYNRTELLALALDSLGKQTLDAARYEILVVDNNSTDDTRAVVMEFMPRVNVRYILERRQGLSHARNRGYQEAQGTYIAYIDDDVKVPPHWAETIKTLGEERAPTVMGGPIIPFYLTEKPAWFKDSYEQLLNYGAQPRQLEPHEEVFGGNFIIRRTVLEAVNGFDPTLGMKGDAIAYGEESKLLQKIRQVQAEVTVYYHPELYVYHLVRAEKMNLFWLARDRFVRGRYVTRVYRSMHDITLRQRFIAVRDVVLGIVQLIIALTYGMLRRDRQQHPYPQNYIYEHVLRLIYRIGMHIERTL